MNFTDKGLAVPNSRITEAEVDPMFPGRWSPRAFDPTPLPAEAVAGLFEAARWAPSCFNEQPWLFVYGTDHAELAAFLQILADRNRLWAGNAPLLAILFAQRTFSHNGRPNRWAGFDCGAAWVSLALQARFMGLYAHAMAGFSPEKAHELLGVPEAEYEAMAAIAVGQYGDREALPGEMREMKAPNDRKPLAEVATKGTFQS